MLKHGKTHFSNPAILLVIPGQGRLNFSPGVSFSSLKGSTAGCSTDQTAGKAAPTTPLATARPCIMDSLAMLDLFDVGCNEEKEFQQQNHWELTKKNGIYSMNPFKPFCKLCISLVICDCTCALHRAALETYCQVPPSIPEH